MKATCTVELGVRELKLVEVVNGRLTRHLEAALPDDAYRDGVPTLTLVRVLSSTVQAMHSVASQARIAISDAGVAVRDFRLPRVPRDELESAVLHEGMRLVPMDPGDVYYAWHARRDGAEYAVYLVAARRPMIEAILKAGTAAGLRVDRIDLKALALARGAAVEDGLLLEWGLSEATLVLMADARPHFFRTFPLEAPPGDPAAQFEEMALALDALVKFIRSAEPSLTVGAGTPLYLAGQFASLPGAEEQVNNRFAFDVRWPSPARVWREDFPWPAHLAAAGLIQPAACGDRLAPSQIGDTHVAA